MASEIQTFTTEEILQALRTMDLHFLEKLPRSELAKFTRLLTPKMTKYIPHVPTAKQSAFLLLDNKEAFYGGAAGGGKSDALLMAALQHVDVKGYSAILFRKTFADLIKPGALISRAKEWLTPFDDVRWVDKERAFYFEEAYGRKRDIRSILQFGYLDNPNDKYAYQGGEYQFAGFDELTHFNEENYQYIFSRCRRLKGTNIPIRLRGASNPPGSGQGVWVYNRFVNPKTVKPGTIFIPAGLSDNPFVDKEEYEKALNELDPVTRAQLKDGNWTIKREGNLFKPREWIEEIDPVMLPPHRRRVRSYDLAATEPSTKNKDPDWTVGMLISEFRGVFYIEDIARIRKRPEQVLQMQESLTKSDGRRTIIREELQPGAAGKELAFNKARTVFFGYNYEAVPASGNKIQRAEPCSAMMERGQIKVVRTCRNKEVFYDELEGFPAEGYGIHDDMVDAMSLGVSSLNTPVIEAPPTQVLTPEGSYWEDTTSMFSFEGWRP